MKTLINAGKLVDGTGTDAQENMSVLVDEGRITQIAPQGSIEANGAKVINAAGQTLIPGLFDLHFHQFLLHT